MLNRGLIVSCQACESEPLYGLNMMRYMANAAVKGGATAIRALADEIPDIKSFVDVQIVGLVKKIYKDSEVYITPTIEDVNTVIASGADVVALDATSRKRPGGVTLEDLVKHIRKNAPHIEILADIDNEENAYKAEKLGIEYVSTTLCGYTKETKGQAIPSYKLIKRLKNNLTKSHLIVEGGIWEVGQIKKVLKYDPYAVIVGTAITRPYDITKRFNAEFKKQTFSKN